MNLKQNFNVTLVSNLTESIQNSIVDFTNYMNFQYFANMYVGSFNTKMSFLFDTGSYWMWTSKPDSVSCPNTHFDGAKSTSYKEL